MSSFIWQDDNDDWFQRQAFVKLFENHIALQKGIIPSQVVKFTEFNNKEPTIDNALASMSDEDARKCKRKFRKLRRRTMKKHPNTKTKSGIMSLVFLDIRAAAHEAYDELKKANSSS